MRAELTIGPLGIAIPSECNLCLFAESVLVGSLKFNSITFGRRLEDQLNSGYIFWEIIHKFLPTLVLQLAGCFEY